MKKLSILLFALIIIFLISFMVLGQLSKSGKAGGLSKGKLTLCPDKPNCVSSQYKNDINHFIEPIIIPPNITPDKQSIEDAIKQTIRELGGSIETEEGSYIAATFSSAIFGFVDDFEVNVDSTQQMIHIRSASRVGHSDLEANSKRVALFKDRFETQLKP